MNTPTMRRIPRRRPFFRCTWAVPDNRRRAATPSTGTRTPGSRSRNVFTTADRQTIPFVKVTDAQGNVREYTAEGTNPEDIAKGERRVMDCIDCHNVVAHRVAPTPEQAVDAAIVSGRISRELPFVRREAVRLAKAEHARGRRRAPGHRRRAAEVLRVERTWRRWPHRRCRRGGQTVYRRNVSRR